MVWYRMHGDTWEISVERMTEYSRSNPSPRYLELIGYYREMHADEGGKEKAPGAEMFAGLMVHRHAESIRGIIDVLGSETIIDYGAGKGHQYRLFRLSGPDGKNYPDIKSFWGVKSITCYDPSFSTFESLPKKRFDGVVSTDVLEHCPREDLPWIIEEIFTFAEEFVYLNVACYPAMKTLPNGENAHCTVEQPEWWLPMFNGAVAANPGLRCFAAFDFVEKGPDGQDRVVTRRTLGESKPG